MPLFSTSGGRAGTRSRGVGSRGRGRTVVLHVRPHKVASRQGAAQRQLTRQRGCGDDASQATGVFPWLRVVRATDAEKIEHGALGLQN